MLKFFSKDGFIFYQNNNVYWILTHDALNDSIAISDSASSRSWNRTRSTLFNFFRLLSNFAYSCLFKLCPNIFFAAGDTDIFGFKLGKWLWQKIFFSKNFHVWSPARTRSPENNIYVIGWFLYCLPVLMRSAGRVEGRWGRFIFVNTQSGCDVSVNDLTIFRTNSLIRKLSFITNVSRSNGYFSIYVFIFVTKRICKSIFWSDQAHEELYCAFCFVVKSESNVACWFLNLNWFNTQFIWYKLVYIRKIDL